MNDVAMICKICNLSCDLKVEKNINTLVVTGNKCGRGYDYAKSQFENGETLLTARCILLNGSMGRLPVISTKPFPAYLIDQAISIIRETQVSAPVEKGAIIIENLLHTGINIISQRRVV